MQSGETKGSEEKSLCFWLNWKLRFNSLEVVRFKFFRKASKLSVSLGQNPVFGLNNTVKTNSRLHMFLSANTDVEAAAFFKQLTN